MTTKKTYNALASLSELKDQFKNFALDWRFIQIDEFEKEVDLLVEKMGIINKDVHYIIDTEIDLVQLDSLGCGKSMDFGHNTTLERVGCDHEHHYLYHNETPIIFGLHIHLNFTETIKPLKNSLVMYINKGDRIKKIHVKVGETYIVPKGVEHATLFSEPNTIEIIWE